MEIYDPVEPSQDTLKPNEEEVPGFEQKVSTVRKFVWGWTTSVQVQTRVEKKKRTLDIHSQGRTQQ